MTSTPNSTSSTDAEQQVRDVIIVGSGPAGYTAALYAARAQLRPLVFEGSVTAGGALMNTTEVENFPGFPDGMQGPELMNELRAQAERFGAELVRDDAVALDLTGDVKTVTDGDGTVHRAAAVILATGSGYRELGLPEEKALSGHGVSWCATCDGFFFRGQDIAVVGGGDSAMEEATFLVALRVVGPRRSSTRVASRLEGDDRASRGRPEDLVRLALRGRADPRRRPRHRDRAAGRPDRRAAHRGPSRGVRRHRPRAPRGALHGQVDLDAGGYVKVAAPGTATNLDGVFAAGDVVDHRYRATQRPVWLCVAAELDPAHGRSWRVRYLHLHGRQRRQQYGGRQSSQRRTA